MVQSLILLGVYPEMNAHVQTNTFIWMFTAPLFTIAKEWIHNPNIHQQVNE